jgi:hypothetical protein
MTFKDLSVNTVFQLVTASGEAYSPVFKKLSDAPLDNAEALQGAAIPRLRLCSFPLTHSVRVVEESRPFSQVR